MENSKDEPGNPSGQHSSNAVPPFSQNRSEIDGVHPALVDQYKSVRVINFIHLAIFGLLLLSCIARPGQLFFLVPLSCVYVWSTLLRVKRRRKLRELGSLLEREDFVSTTIELKFAQALGVFKKYSGKLLKETEFSSPHQPINLKPPVGKQKQFFDTPSAIPANLYVDPDSKKILAVNTSKGLFLVDNELGAGINPWGQAALNIGIATVMVPTGIVIGFLCAAAGSLDTRLPREVPKGLTAKKYYDLGRRYKDAGWTELSRKALNNAIELDPTNVGKKAEMYLKAKIPHRPVSEEAVKMNIKGFNEAIFNPRNAEKTWKDCIEKYPEFEWPYSNLGSQYLKEQRYEEANAMLSKAIELNPYYTNALVRMAELKQAKGDKAGAEKYVNLALEYEPDNQDAIELKASLSKSE